MEEKRRKNFLERLFYGKSKNQINYFKLLFNDFQTEEMLDEMN